MTAIYIPLYLQSKSELAGMNTYGSVLVRIDVFCYSVTKMEKNNLEKGHAVKFCIKLREGATDPYGKIQRAFGNNSLSRAQIFRWHKDLFLIWFVRLLALGLLLSYCASLG
jgi:hypothetical protein